MQPCRTGVSGPRPQGTRRDWRRSLPTLNVRGLTLRPLRLDDAPSLFHHLTQPAVARYILQPPGSDEGFRRFIRWTHAARTRGAHVCFGIVPTGHLHPVGVIQIWPLRSDFSVAEWGFVLAEAYWGSGLFGVSARALLTFAFDTLGVHRVEARVAVENERGNGGLRKLGAVREAYLRRCSPCGGRYVDHAMWSILRDEWIVQSQGTRAMTPAPHVHRSK
jgi:ribosomal-protein-alanine N-acetyltransferase